MSVWVAMPSARRPEEADPVLRQWLKQGYRLALVRDVVNTQWTPAELTFFSGPIWGGYPGYAVSMNYLCKEILRYDPRADFIVATGDDTLPDPTKRAEVIGQECSEHFEELWRDSSSDEHPYETSLSTFGVMQPTGDEWADRAGRIIERIAGSPWIGREFARRMYGGAGPYWYEYRHCFVDEELQCVAQKLGVFWQRPDLTQHHENWARAHAGRPQDMPEFLREANSPEHWAKYSAIFKARKEAGFPGHEPIL
jgi:hypothetical protein